MRAFKPLTQDRLREILERGRTARVAVIGDFCLDIYWFIDPARGEVSIETGLVTQPVREQRYSLGGAGNVAANLAALGCGNLTALGAVGDDPWGRELVRLLGGLAVDTEDMLVPETDWSTLAYTKPHIDNRETNRIDFGNFNRLPAAARDLLARVERRLEEVDVTIVNQQVPQGLHVPELREGLAGLIRKHPGRKILVDSRHFNADYAGAIFKMNEQEALRLCGLSTGPEGAVLREDLLSAADRLYEGHRRPVFITRGAEGMLVRDEGGATEIPAIRVSGPIDTVGAGDTALAGIALGLAAGGTPVEAAQLGNLAASVTVKKLHTTGTATPEEIMTAHKIISKQYE